MNKTIRHQKVHVSLTIEETKLPYDIEVTSWGVGNFRVSFKPKDTNYLIELNNRGDIIASEQLKKIYIKEITETLYWIYNNMNIIFSVLEENMDITIFGGLIIKGGKRATKEQSNTQKILLKLLTESAILN